MNKKLNYKDLAKEALILTGADAIVAAAVDVYKRQVSSGARTQQRFGLSFEDASAAIGYLDSIRGCLCWLAFIDAPDDTIRVRLRSRFVAINTLAERHHGGGHAFALSLIHI